jgi:hypothetical protein
MAEGKIEGLYVRDCILVGAFVVFALAILLFVLLQVMSFLQDVSASVVLAAAMVLCSAAMLTVAVWTMHQLDIHKEDAYGAEIQLRQPSKECEESR